METQIKINTTDKHIIYGTLNSDDNNKLIIFVHGLTGHQNEHIFYNSSKYFPKKGFATFRFDLYSGEKGGRLLSKCTIENHAEDICTVIKYFKDSYKTIHVVGHSLGGPCILLANTENVDSIVLWDPSFNILKNTSNEMKYEKNINKYILEWGTEFLLSPEMIHSWKKLGDKLLQKFSKPTKIICAGKGILYKDWEEKIPLIQTECELHIIKEAGHCFDEKESETELFTETLKWFNR